MASKYVPERKDIIMFDFEPTKGKEIGKYRPAIALSSKFFNKNNRADYLLPNKH